MYTQDLKKLYFHIFIIDDDKKIRLLLKKFLENNGFRVSDAENTHQAKKIMENIASLDIPLIVEIGSGINWEQAH